MTAQSKQKYGRTFTEAERRRHSEEARIPLADRVARDDELLRALGQTKTWEYAEVAGVSEKVAKERLRRLFEQGRAERFKERGQIGWTYVTVVRPGETVA
jgi:hypothetical protein